MCSLVSDHQPVLVVASATAGLLGWVALVVARQKNTRMRCSGVRDQLGLSKRVTYPAKQNTMPKSKVAKEGARRASSGGGDVGAQGFETK